MNVYRVDGELLTLKEINSTNLHEDTPLNCWLPVLFGEGYYCYFTNKDEAKAALLAIVDEKMQYLEKLKEEFK